jgi:hypothetical protein
MTLPHERRCGRPPPRVCFGHEAKRRVQQCQWRWASTLHTACAFGFQLTAEVAGHCEANVPYNHAGSKFKLIFFVLTQL